MSASGQSSPGAFFDPVRAAVRTGLLSPPLDAHKPARQPAYPSSASAGRHLDEEAAVVDAKPGCPPAHARPHLPLFYSPANVFPPTPASVFSTASPVHAPRRGSAGSSDKWEGLPLPSLPLSAPHSRRPSGDGAPPRFDGPDDGPSSLVYADPAGQSVVRRALSVRDLAFANEDAPEETKPPGSKSHVTDRVGAPTAATTTATTTATAAATNTKKRRRTLEPERERHDLRPRTAVKQADVGDGAREKPFPSAPPPSSSSPRKKRKAAPSSKAAVAHAGASSADVVGAHDKGSGKAASSNVTASRRKTTHSLIERRRREKINDRLVQLRNLVPACKKEVEEREKKRSSKRRSHGRRAAAVETPAQERTCGMEDAGMHKLDILTHAVDYIYELHAKIAALESRLPVTEADDGGASPGTSTSVSSPSSPFDERGVPQTAVDDDEDDQLQEVDDDEDDQLQEVDDEDMDAIDGADLSTSPRNGAAGAVVVVVEPKRSASPDTRRIIRSPAFDPVWDARNARDASSSRPAAVDARDHVHANNASSRAEDEDPDLSAASLLLSFSSPEVLRPQSFARAGTGNRGRVGGVHGEVPRNVVVAKGQQERPCSLAAMPAVGAATTLPRAKPAVAGWSTKRHGAEGGGTRRGENEGELEETGEEVEEVPELVLDATAVSSSSSSSSR